MSAKFECRAIYGLGITSLADFVRLLSKYKAVLEAGVDYVTTSTIQLPRKKTVLVFDSVRQLFRLYKQIKPEHVIIISDTPTILKEIPSAVPLDYNNNRSFEFNFKEPDVQMVLRSLKSKSTIESKFVSHDNLGYHVDKIKGSGELLNAYLSVISSMPFDKRSLLRAAFVDFYTAKTPNIKSIMAAIKQIAKTYTFDKDLDLFTKLMSEGAVTYHAAINSPDAAALAAKKFKVDPYAISYFRKMLNQRDLNVERYKKHNVQLKVKSQR